MLPDLLPLTTAEVVGLMAPFTAPGLRLVARALPTYLRADGLDLIVRLYMTR